MPVLKIWDDTTWVEIPSGAAIPLGKVFTCEDPIAGRFYRVAHAAVPMTLIRVGGQCIAGTNLTLKIWLNAETQRQSAGDEVWGGSGKVFTAIYAVYDSGFTNVLVPKYGVIWLETDALTGVVTDFEFSYIWEPT